MNEVKFIEFKHTPGEKHVGIITVLVNNLIFLRYKVSPGKNGGHFPNAASYKVTEYGQESYVAAFLVESAMLKEQIDSCLKSNIHRELGSPSTTSGGYKNPSNNYSNPYSPPAPKSQDFGEVLF